MLPTIKLRLNELCTFHAAGEPLLNRHLHVLQTHPVTETAFDPGLGARYSVSLVPGAHERPALHPSHVRGVCQSQPTVDSLDTNAYFDEWWNFSGGNETF